MSLKRFAIVPLIVLCLIASFFSLSASADNQCGVYLTIGNQACLSDGSQVIVKQNLSGDRYYYNFNYIYIPTRYWIRNDEVTIRIGWKSFDGTWFRNDGSIEPYYSSQNCAIPVFGAVSSTSGWTINSGFVISGISVGGYGALIRVKCQLTNFDGVVTIKPDNLQASFGATLASNNPPCFILGVDSSPDWQSVISGIHYIQEWSYQIMSNSYDFYDLLSLENIYTVSSVSYDSDNDSFSITESSDLPWFEAILESLKTISAPVISQAEYENRAKDVGADDALDEAYNSVDNSFSSLGELGGLGSFGEFNGSALGENGASSLLGWFSQECKDDIDNVNSNRMKQASGGQQFISIFDEHIEDYNEEVNLDDSAAD